MILYELNIMVIVLFNCFILCFFLSLILHFLSDSLIPIIDYSLSGDRHVDFSVIVHVY